MQKDPPDNHSDRDSTQIEYEVPFHHVATPQPKQPVQQTQRVQQIQVQPKQQVPAQVPKKKRITNQPQSKDDTDEQEIIKEKLAAFQKEKEQYTYCKKGSIKEESKCDINAQGYAVADYKEDKIYPKLDYCNEDDGSSVEPNTCKCNYEFSPVGCTCPRESDNLNDVPKERCPCPSEFSLLEMDARRYDACLPSWNNQNEVFVGDGQLT
ncbi:MAG: hypothetical protein EZS28_052986, partial [Streblomastix strix]